MPKEQPRDRLAWEEFERRFRIAFDREMTPDERRWFRLSNLILNPTDEEEENSSVA